VLQIFQHGSINKQVVFIRTTGRSCILIYECIYTNVEKQDHFIECQQDNLHPYRDG